jgi:hypothetical protein
VELRAIAGAVTRAGALEPPAADRDLAGFFERRVAPGLGRAPAARGWTGSLARAAALLVAFAGGVAAERYAFDPGAGAAPSADGAASAGVGVSPVGPPPVAARPAGPIADRVLVAYRDAGRQGASDLGRTLIALAAIGE